MKSHLKFTREQRNGILVLIFFIVVIQCLYFFIEGPVHKEEIDHELLFAFNKEIDSLRIIADENQKIKIYPFNPNFITDYKGYTLGMSNEEIDRLLRFRAQDRWINSTAQFKEVTKVSDSLLRILSPYFKFPDWVTNPKPQYTTNFNRTIAIKNYDQKIDLNTATAKQLQGVNGIGEKLSDRIIKYRSKFKGGFIADIQLIDVYGLSPEVIERITNEFTVKTPRQINKFNLNTVTIEELVTIQHIDYELAYEIIDQRTLRDGFNSVDELTKVKGFPITKFEIIKLYLSLE